MFVPDRINMLTGINDTVERPESDLDPYMRSLFSVLHHKRVNATMRFARRLPVLITARYSNMATDPQIPFSLGGGFKFNEKPRLALLKK